MKARDVMTTQVATVTADTPVQEVAAMMLAQRVSGIPVVDREGRVRGIVSEGDLMRRSETGTNAAPRSWWLRLFGSEEREARDYIKTHGRTAQDVMTHPVITATPDDDIAAVAMLLEKRRIKRVPVVAHGQLLGIVSRADLLRALAACGQAGDAIAAGPASDRQIRDELTAHLARQPWAGSAMVNVIVNDGVVHLWGVYDSEEQHEALRVAARNAKGARGLEDHLSRSRPERG